MPDFVETGSVLRWLFLIAAGSMGPFGVVLLIAFLLYYLITADAFGAPPLAPFSPLIQRDMKDSLLKANAYSLALRPATFDSKNRRRLSALPLSDESGGNGQNNDEKSGNEEKKEDEKPSGTVNDAQKITEKIQAQNISKSNTDAQKKAGKNSAEQGGKRQ